MDDLANPELLRAISECTHADTPESRRALYAALLASKLWVPLWNVHEKGASPNPLRPFLVRAAEDDALPGFTDNTAIELWPGRSEPRSFAVCPGKGLCSIARRINVIVEINPAGPLRWHINRTDLRILADGEIPPVVGRDFTPSRERRPPLAYVGAPLDPLSGEAVAGLQQALRGHPRVRRAFLFEGSRGFGSRLVIGLDVGDEPREGPMDDRIDGVARAIRDVFIQAGVRRDFDITALDGDLLRSVEERVVPVVP